MLGFDRRLSDNTWLSLAANHVDLNDKPINLNDKPTDSSSQFASVGLSHEVGQWNLSLGADYYWSRYSIGFYTSEYSSAFDSLATLVYHLSGKVLLSERVDMQLNLEVTRPDGVEDSVYGGVGFSVYW